jgi:hypothetical protein
MRDKIIPRHLLVFLLILVFGCGRQQPADLPVAARGDASRPQKLPDADFSLTVEMYLREFETNEEAAQAKYQGKTVELSGVVDNVGRFYDHDFVELQEGGDTPRNFLGVRCEMIDAEPWAKVVPGQRIKVKGQYEGIGRTLSSCVFVETGASPAITISTADLAKEYAADLEAVRKKYTRRWLIVSGEVVEKGAYRVVLKGDGKVQVVCDFLEFKNTSHEGLFKRSWMDEMMPGQTATILVYGDRASFFAQGEVGFVACFPITSSGGSAPRATR